MSTKVVIAALKGGSGKTTLTLGIISLLRKKGIAVTPFKKGPDYIDSAWLSYAAQKDCYNLDLFLMEKDKILTSFNAHTPNTDITIIEGNRGIYDGFDIDGSCSTAELAKLLNSPVILIVDCTMASLTIAAIVLGCMHFDPQVKIKGVILNQVGSKRQESLLRSAIERYCNIPVIGAVPKLKEETLPTREMGLITVSEYQYSEKIITTLTQIAQRYIDVDKLMEIAKESVIPTHLTSPATPHISSPSMGEDKACPERSRRGEGDKIKPCIGIIRDSAFNFYYPDNLELLKQSGLELIEINSLKDKKLPSIDGLYIGGGFPETHAELLTANKAFHASLKEAIENGLHVYAECGGLIYLGKSLIWGEKEYPMSGVLPIVFGYQQKPAGHGYTILKVEKNNPFFKTGTIIKGHEFHYSHVLNYDEDKLYMAMSVQRGYGANGNRDGFCYKNVLAMYTHLHALSSINIPFSTFSPPFP